MKKKLNIAELIGQIAFLFILLVAPLATYKIPDHAGINSVTGNKMMINGSTGTLHFDDLFETAPLFYLIFLALIVCNIVLCVVSIKKDLPQADSKIHIILPILIFVLFVFVRGFMLLGAIPYDGNADITSATVYTLLIALAFIIIILAVIKRSQGEKSSVHPSAQSSSSAAELQKYSDLLEKGVITQAEFDAKKKQLLGL